MKDHAPTNRVKVYKRFPYSSLVIYNGVTALHYIFGSLGIIIGYNFLQWQLGLIFGIIYIVFAFVQMYVIMPLTVCPNCVYYSMKDGLCTSGLNIVSRKIAKKGDLKHFGDRAKGYLSHNKLYMGALFIPIVIMIPALIINFSFLLFIFFILVIILLLFRMFVVFKKVACVHCSAKYRCPNAKSMGIVD